MGTTRNKQQTSGKAPAFPRVAFAGFYFLPAARDKGYNIHGLGICEAAF
jgi:hypothetical protein